MADPTASTGKPTAEQRPVPAVARPTGMCRYVLFQGVVRYGVVVFFCWMLVGRLETGQWLSRPDSVAPMAVVSLVGGFVVGLAGWMIKRRRRG